MARKPKTQLRPEIAASVPVPEFVAPDETSAPARRGRRSKALASSPALLPAAGVDDPTKTPGRRGRGRKQKQAAGVEAATLPPDTAFEQASAEAGPSAAGPEHAQTEDDALVAGTAFPPDEAGAGDAGQGGAHIDAAALGAVPSAIGPEAAARVAPAARWDRATDTAEFHWPEIERVAAQGGPNQAMAKLLVAARAEGASSSWPL